MQAKIGPRLAALFIVALFPLVAGFWLVLSGTFARAAIADAERSRAALMNQADRLTFDLDLELSLLDSYLARRASASVDIRASALEALDEYRLSARWPDLVKALYLVERNAGGAAGADGGSVTVSVLSSGGQTGGDDARDAAMLMEQYRNAEPGGASPSPLMGYLLGRSSTTRVERERGDAPEQGRLFQFRFVVALLDEDALLAEALVSLDEQYFGPASDFPEYALAVRDTTGALRYGEAPPGREGPEFSRPLMRDPNRLDLPRFYFSFASGLEPGPMQIDRYRYQTLELRGLWSLELYRRGLPLQDAVRREARLWSLGAAAILLLLYGSVVALYLAARRARELASRERAFVASVTHELKTPIAVTLSAGENLEKGIVPGERVRAYGSTVAREARRLSDSVERLLLVAGMESAPAFKRGEAVNLQELCASVIERLSAYPGEAAAVFELEASDHPVAEGSRPLIESAVECVLANAAKYAGGSVKVRAFEERRGGRRLAVVSCADKGPGLSREERRRVFEPFYRGSLALAKGLPGTGIGLYLARRAARLHGGDARLFIPQGGGLGVELSFRSYV
jgi:signal transduction histidine kinase